MKKKILLFWSLLLFIILLITCIASLSIGPSGITINKLIYAFTDNSSYYYDIFFNERLPRIILAIAVGGALSISGALLQGIFNNPLVEPYTLGISGGACLGVSIAILFKLNKIFGGLFITIAGFTGAIAVIFIIFILNIKEKNFKSNKILLTGVMISFITSSLIMLIMSIAKTDDLHNIILWTMGSLYESNVFLIITAVIISLIGLIISYLFSIDLNTFMLGEEESIHLGINSSKKKVILFIITSLLTGVSVSVCGIIGFVGLIIPHLVRMVISKDYRILLIVSYLLGAIFLIASDAIARVIISPNEFPVGVITGILGGIVFIYALIKRRIL